MRRGLKLAGLAAVIGLAAGVSGCVAYPDGPDTYTYAPAYGYYGGYYDPDYYYYGPGYVSGSFFYYNSPGRYWRGGHYRGPWHGGPHDFGHGGGGYHGHGGGGSGHGHGGGPGPGPVRH